MNKMLRKLIIPFGRRLPHMALRSGSSASSLKPPASGVERATEEKADEPVKYFGSNAATWSAKSTRSGGAEEALWYQPYVISASLAVFLLYFCVLREENDIDRKLEGSLYDHVSGLEELQLTVAYKYGKENGADTKDVEQRLTELGIDVKQLEVMRLAETK